jgi:hypothetical protein
VSLNFKLIAPVSVAFINREFNFLAKPFQTKLQNPYAVYGTLRTLQMPS